MFRRTTLWRGAAALSAAALVLAGCADDNGEPAETPPPGEDMFEETFTLGAILPTTGGLADFGVGMIAAVELAVSQMNEAGGVWGNDVVLLTENEGPTTEPEVVLAALDAMIQQGVNAVVGPAASGSSETVIEALYNEQIVMVSPSNTGPGFTTHEFGDFYFRTSPSDIIQGSALAQVIINDAHPTLGILSQQTVYGEGLSNQIRDVFEGGGGEVTYQEFYDEAQTEFSSEIAALVAEDPDAFVLVSYAESRQIIPALIGAGFTPQDKQWYLVDGNRLDYSDDLDPGTLTGVKASQPIGLGEEIIPQVQEHHGEPTPETAYIPESYDAAILLGLAAIAANSDDGVALRDGMIAVTTGSTECTTFAQCKELLEEGQDILYRGVTGTIFTPAGDPAEALIGIFEYGDDNTFSEIDRVPGSM